ncbi:MAG: hypothetical protein NTZ74_04475 [Chloroflexi bacterium]|nr:hypothetical protein [Chloroflexota bacterium]
MNRPTIRLFLGIDIIITVAMLIWLILTPSISTHPFILIYSFERFLLITFSGIFILLLLIGFTFSKKRGINFIFDWLMLSKTLFSIIFIIIVIVLIFFVGMILNVYGPRAFFFERMLPISVLIFLSAIETIIFQLITSRGVLGKTVKSSLLTLFTRIYSKASTIFTQLAEFTKTKIGSILFLFIVNAPIIFINSIQFKYPLGFAGLYSLMAEGIVKNHFLLPMDIPFYGPGGIPFAYPPLGLYLMAFFIGPLSVPPLMYLRFAPPLFFLISTVIFFFVVFKYTHSRRAGMISAILLAYSSLNYDIQGTSGGIVRGLALCFLFLGIFYFLCAKSLSNKKYYYLTGLFFAITILSHLGYAFIFGLILGLDILLQVFNFDLWKKNISIVFVGFLLSSPWWVTVWSRYGFETFKFAFNSHGNSYFTQILAGTKPLIPWLSISFDAFNTNLFFGSIALVGLIYIIFKGDLFLPLLFSILMFSSSENGRYLILVGAMTIGVLISKISQSFNENQKTNQLSIQSAIFIGVCLFLICYSDVSKTLSYRPVVSDELISLSSAVKKNSKPTTNYFVVVENRTQDQESEWMPYFFSMTPAVGFWGSEWIKPTPNQVTYTDLKNCLATELFSCDNFLYTDFIITHKDDENNPQIMSDTNWVLIYSNEQFNLWKKV